MITINLLPEEYRRRAKLPVKFILSSAAATAIAGSLIAAWCWMHFGEMAEIRSQKELRELEMSGLEPQVEYHDALDAEIKIFAAREQTLAEISKNRVLWTEKVDQLVDVVNTSGSNEHFIWFDDITAKLETPRRGSTNFGSFRASGHSGAEEFNQVANFMSDLEDPRVSGFSADFNKPKLPEGNKNRRDEDLIPAVNWSFPLSLELRSPEERAAARQGSAK